MMFFIKLDISKLKSKSIKEINISQIIVKNNNIVIKRKITFEDINI